MTCKKCQELCVQYAIRGPKDLGRAITIARQNVDDGTISVVIEPNPLSLPPFQSLTAAGPWNDFVAYQFKCNHCGELFSLHAETYHGSGGAWEPLRKAARDTIHSGE